MNTNIRFRRAGLEDLEEVVTLRMRAMLEEGIVSWDTKEEYMQYVSEYKTYYGQSFAIGDHVAVLGFSEKEAAAVSLGGVTFYTVMPSDSNPKGEKAYIVNMYTKPEFRRRGLGELIVRELITACYEKGVEEIALESSPMAESLYRSVGFIKQGTEYIYKKK